MTCLPSWELQIKFTSYNTYMVTNLIPTLNVHASQKKCFQKIDRPLYWVYWVLYWLKWTTLTVTADSLNTSQRRYFIRQFEKKPHRYLVSISIGFAQPVAVVNKWLSVNTKLKRNDQRHGIIPESVHCC